MDKLTIWADGACEPNPGKGGYGYIIRGMGKQLTANGYDPQSTNQRMEITAILEALKNISKPYDITIYTDSMYCVNTITKWLAGWLAKKIEKANMDLWYEYVRLSAPHKIQIYHVKGHAGHEMNEACDQLAVSAIKGVKVYEVKEVPESF